MHRTVVLAPDHRTLRSAFLRTGLCLRSRLFALFWLIKGQVIHIGGLNRLYFHVLEELFAAEKGSIDSKCGERLSFGRVRWNGDSFERQGEFTLAPRKVLFRHVGPRLGIHLRLGLGLCYLFFRDLVFARNYLVVVVREDL